MGVRRLMKLIKPFVLTAHSVAKLVHNIRTDPWEVWGISDSSAQVHSVLDSKFVPLRCGTRPGSLSKSLDNATFFGTYSVFWRDRRSYYLGQDHSLGRTRENGEAWPRHRLES